MLLWLPIPNGSFEPALKLHGKDSAMRSMKLLVAMALVTALVAGPVMAQEAAPVAAEPATPAAAAPAAEAPAKAKAIHKKHVKKHERRMHHKKTTAPEAAPAVAE
jgi:hypothetical protein